MNVQPHSKKMASYKRKRRDEKNYVLKEMSVNINRFSANVLTNQETKSSSDSSEVQNNLLGNSVKLEVFENQASDKVVSVIGKSKSNDSLLAPKSEISNDSSIGTEEDINGKDIDPAKVDKKSKTTVKQSLSLDEKLTHLHKLMAISNVYAKYVSKNLEQSSKMTNVLNKSNSRNHEQTVSEKKCVRDSPSKFSPPPMFKGTLKDYQRDGCEWLKILFENAASGILADEMGLGKTVQTIAIITHMINKNLKGPFLVVAPLSTLPHWISEFERFCPSVPVTLFHGRDFERKALKRSFRIQKLQTFGGEVKVYPVLVTSYETILMEARFFGSYKWLYLVVDEGHRLKREDCKLTRLLSSFSSSHRLLLTGTPLQNNLQEMWSLLRFLTPEIFGNIEELELLISSDDVQSETIVEQEIKEGVVSKLRAALQPFILRRLKKDVNLKLPPKKEILVYAPMTRVQWELYNATLDLSIFSLLRPKQDEDVEMSSKRKCTKDIRYTMKSDDEFFDDLSETESITDVSSNLKEKILPVDKDGNRCWINLKMQSPHTQLRKICNHPYLVQMPLDGEHMLVNEDMIMKSGKMMILDVLLPRLKAEGHKVLIFSTMTKILDIIEEYVIFRNHSYSRLDGSVTLEDRITEINRFLENKDVFLFLISTRAGNLGLNLISADTVIIFDSDWNPQVDLQAQDRCHRIGQTKPVLVYRFVTKGSIDEKIIQYAQRKRRLEKLVLHDDCYKGVKAEKPEKFANIEELKTLLHSSDYYKTVNESGSVLSDQEIKEILDRSDMI